MSGRHSCRVPRRIQSQFTQKSWPSGEFGKFPRASSSSAGRPRQVAANRARAGEKFLIAHFPASLSMSRLAGSSGTLRQALEQKSRAHPPAHVATSLHSFTQFQPGHQPENWSALQKEDTAHGSVSLSSGTSVRCSCRNFGTCIMHLRVLYVVMDCSGTSVHSARRRRGAKPLAVAAAAISVGQDVAASQQPSVAAAALFRLPSACSQFSTMCQ